MARIRKPRYFDKYKLKKMVSFLGTDAIDHYTRVFMSFPFNVLHNHLPLKFKFMPESYVLVERDDIIGMITVSPTAGNPYKLFITRLFLEQNYFNAGKQLVEYVVAKYGAWGASNFVVQIDESHEELLNLFINGCGFRQCSSEQLWKVNTANFSKEENLFIRPFKNSDALAVAMLFNDSVVTHFRHSISRTKDEYLEPFFYGLNNFSKFKYVIEDDNLKTVKAYFSITTSDNQNYILDLTTSPWYECSYEDIFHFAMSQISKRQKDFHLFVRLKKFVVKAETFEKYLVDKGFSCIQNKLILTKDFYKIIKETEKNERVVLFNEISGKPAFKTSYEQ